MEFIMFSMNGILTLFPVMVVANSMRDASEAGNGVLLCSVQKAR